MAARSTVDIFERKTPEYDHHYAVVELEQTHRRIEGLEFVFVELPKFRPEAIASERMRKLWLRFLTETGNDTPEAATELLEDPATREALECVVESGFRFPIPTGLHPTAQGWLAEPTLGWFDQGKPNHNVVPSGTGVGNPSKGNTSHGPPVGRNRVAVRGSFAEASQGCPNAFGAENPDRRK